MKILITGITGQDGRLLAEYLLEDGHDIYGICRPRTQGFPELEGVDLCYVDITDAELVSRVIQTGKFDEIYNLAAQTHVGESFNHPAYTFNVNALAAINIMQAAGDTPLYQASTSEMFGHSTDEDGKQSEKTEMLPRSPYGVAKLAAHNMMKINRELRGWPHYAGILFNHESRYRGANFVTRKVVDYLASNSPDPLVLGNLEAKRDWGAAEEYVRSMVQILRARKQDYVVATGSTNTVRQWVDACFRASNLYLEWDGDKGYDGSGRCRVIGGDARYLRPLDIDYLCGNADKIFEDLGWRAIHNINDIAYGMVNSSCLERVA